MMFHEMDKLVGSFDNAILKAVEPTQEAIDIVADEWDDQYKNDEPINLNPDTCAGLTQVQIDSAVKFLYANA
jgi:hypothetical protein